MKLTLEQLRAITTGAVEITREETGVRFFRFNQEQRELRQPRVTYPAEKCTPPPASSFSSGRTAPASTCAPPWKKALPATTSPLTCL